MTTQHQVRLLSFMAGAGFFCALAQAQPQFVKVTADVEVTWWSQQVAKPYLWNVQCVVGTNSWQMDGDFSGNSQVTYWFTGTNILEYSVVNRMIPDGAPFGAVNIRVSDSVDGNPGTLSACGPGGKRLEIGPDRLCELGRIAWLAFCSGPCLKRQGRLIFPPYSDWKELICAPSGFSDRTVVFPDTFGLPKSVNLYTMGGQPVFQYRTTSSTNFLGWEFPLEFQMAQYRPAFRPDARFVIGNNGWELALTAKAKVTGIGLATGLRTPPEGLTK